MLDYYDSYPSVAFLLCCFNRKRHQGIFVGSNFHVTPDAAAPGYSGDLADLAGGRVLHVGPTKSLTFNKGPKGCHAVFAVSIIVVLLYVCIKYMIVS